MRRIELADSTFAVAGRFERWSHRELTELLEAREADVTGWVNQYTTALLCASEEHNAIADAMVWGIPILREGQVYELVEEGFIELEEEEEKVGSLALFGELRGLLHGAPPDNETWLAICALLDRCTPEEVGVMVRYARAHLDAWARQGAFDDLHGEAAAALNAHATGGERRRTGFDGELCLVPPSWLSALIQGERHEKFELIQAIDLTNVSLASDAIITMLENPHLLHVRQLALSKRKATTRSLVSVLCSSPWRERLTLLRFGEVPFNMGHWFRELGKEPGALRQVDLLQHESYISFDMFDMPYFEMVDTLALDRSCLTFFNHYMGRKRSASAPYIRELTIQNFLATDAPKLFKNGLVVENLKVLRVMSYDSFSGWNKLLSTPYPGYLDLFDISSPSAHMLKRFTARNVDSIQKSLSKSRMLNCVNELKLGPFYDLLDVEAVRASHPALVVSR